MNFRLSKKAVSGLIVAVLLVAVALTIGGLVMGWISGYTDTNLATENQKKQDDCFKREFKVVSVIAYGTKPTTSRPTGGNGNATIIIENKNDEPIKGFLFKFIGDDNSLYAFQMKNSSAALGAYIRNTYYLDNMSVSTSLTNPYSFNYSATNNYTLTKVEVYPIIDIVVDTTQEKVCESKLKSIESSNFVNTQ